MFRPLDYTLWNKSITLLDKYFTKNPYTPDEGAVLVSLKDKQVTLSAYRQDLGGVKITLPVESISPEEVQEILVWGESFKNLPTKIKSLESINISLTKEAIRYSHPNLGEIEEGIYLGANIIPEYPEGEELIPVVQDLPNFLRAIAIDKNTEWPHISLGVNKASVISYYKGCYSKLVVPVKSTREMQMQLKQTQVLCLQELGNVGGLYLTELEGVPHLTYKGYRTSKKNEVDVSYEFSWPIIDDDFEDCLPEDLNWPQTSKLKVNKLRLNDILTWQEHTQVNEVEVSYQAPRLIIRGGTEAFCECEEVKETGSIPWRKCKFPLASLIEALEIKNLAEEIYVSIYELPLEDGAQPGLLLEGHIQKALVIGEAI